MPYLPKAGERVEFSNNLYGCVPHMTKCHVYTVIEDTVQEEWPYETYALRGVSFYPEPKVHVLNDAGRHVALKLSRFRKVEEHSNG